MPSVKYFWNLNIILGKGFEDFSGDVGKKKSLVLDIRSGLHILFFHSEIAAVAQSVEHFLGKEEVSSSSLDSSSTFFSGRIVPVKLAVLPVGLVCSGISDSFRKKLDSWREFEVFTVEFPVFLCMISSQLLLSVIFLYWRYGLVLGLCAGVNNMMEYL